MTAPERIYLQDAGDYDAAAKLEVTWCVEPQDPADTEYVRADLAPALGVPEVAALVEAVRDLLTWDHGRGRPIPSRHRDPLLRALAALRGEGNP